MLEFKEEVIEFKFQGEKHQVRKPNNGEIKLYNKELKKCKDDSDKQEKALMNFLNDLGLKEEVFNKLTPKQSELILKELYGSEKN